MNEYQKKQLAECREFESTLAPIIAELGADWSLEPLKEEYDFLPRWRTITGANGRQLWAQLDRDRIEFRACNWPAYTDKDGRTKETKVGDLYGPRESTPVTTASAARPAKAIAKQINSRLMPEYDRLWERLETIAASSQRYADKQKTALAALAKATGDDRPPFYVKDMPGDTMVVEFNSPGDVKLRLDWTEAVQVINLIRKLRAKAAA